GPTVTVNVVGYGKYAVEGTTYTTTQTFNVEEGADFTVAPVEFDDEDPLFAYIAIGDSNGNERLSPKGGNLKVYSDTIITVYFNASVDPEEPYYNFVFMTNYELSTAFLGSLNQEDLFNEDDYPPVAPSYEGAEFIGWATENISGDAAKQAGNCMDDSELLNYCLSADANATLYAIYSLPQMVIAEEELLEVMTMKETFVDNTNSHKAYFTVLFSEDGLNAGDKIVEAGVLASANNDKTENATPNGGAGIIKGVVTGDSYPILYTYAVYSNSHSALTVYAKGFVTVQHYDGTLETTYTSVYTEALAAY
ncbi:MAG TPA: hypothetical protein DDY98_03145, partial [Ruminococcaceae bacterium]|nr:hypothetical protein [Oscillospiraceae bacterium]